ncbi:putative B3 domain-containing protein REM15-like [Capsicum annuum]|nr:putative B3 domain-containing protein REM15-like [Capsicum annuum]
MAEQIATASMTTTASILTMDPNHPNHLRASDNPSMTLYLPLDFMKSNGLMDESEMILVNEKQRSWREFCIMNCLKEGDRLMFEIVSNGETPMFIFHGSPSIQANEVKMKKLDAERMSDKGLRLKNSSTTTPESQLDASTYVYVNCHFISTIKPYTIKNPTLYLPLDFVKSNGLMDESEMILVNEKQRSWSVWLGQTGHHFGILKGWT